VEAAEATGADALVGGFFLVSGPVNAVSITGRSNATYKTYISSRFLLGLGGAVPDATSPLLTFFKDEVAAAAAAASAAG
jgi:hypothetical protein